MTRRRHQPHGQQTSTVYKEYGHGEGEYVSSAKKKKFKVFFNFPKMLR